MVTVREIIRTYKQLKSLKGTARTLACAKYTVKKYVRWAESQGYLGEVLPSEAEMVNAWALHEAQTYVPQPSPLEVLKEIIWEWLEQGLNLRRIQVLLGERHGWKGSYESLKRFTKPQRETHKTYVRLEVAPGAEAQVDFGLMGDLWDPLMRKNRKVWLFLMTLAHSRFAYGELVFSQDIPTWVGCHRRAFQYFGGVPAKILLDNLKSAIIKACQCDPLVQKTYLKLAEHYGFVISPCRVATPRHKGKVERGVPYVRNAFWKGREIRDLVTANAELREWNMNQAGLRDHGTTRQQPRVVFETVEKQALLPLPEKPFDLVTFKMAKVHPDCHVTVEGAYYSVPFRYTGRELLVHLTNNMIDLYLNHELVASHTRTYRKGHRTTVLAHYPPEKAAFLEHQPQWCLAESEKVGPATHELIRQLLLEGHPYDNLRKAQNILGLQRKYLPAQIEAACQRALKYDTTTYISIKNILARGLEAESVASREEPMVVSGSYAFERPVTDFTRDWATQN
jgi:transposase